MPTTPSVLQQNRIYFSGLLTVLLSGTIFLIVNGKAAAFIPVNSYHPFLLNVFFVNYTFIGDSIFAICLIAALLFYYKRKQQGMALLYAFLISITVIQVVKNLLMGSAPQLFFEAGQYLRVTEELPLANIYPSGHTATAFAIATVMVLMMKDKSWQLLILIAAVLAGYSRIYLAQHFLSGIIIGAMIGSVSGVLAVYLAKNIKGIKRSIKKMHRLPSTASSPSAVQPV